MQVCLECGEDYSDQHQGPCQVCGGPVRPIRNPAEALIGRELGGKYRLTALLGEGAMGSVYRASRTTLEGAVAIKVLRVGQKGADEALSRFYQEARTSSQLKHPNNITVFDFGHTDDGIAFIAMELIGGVPLSALETPMPPGRALNIVRQICGALSEAHHLGMVHRDLKPDNIMVGTLQGSDMVRVMDYGIAKVLDATQHLTGTGAVIGTPKYISPEQVTGSGVDGRSDIYSLGVILYQLVTGRPPFEADSALQLILQHVHDEPTPPSQLLPLPEALNHLILSCLAKDREARPDSMAALRTDVERLLTQVDINVLGRVSAPSPIVPEDDWEPVDSESPNAPAVSKRLLLVFMMLLLFATAAIFAATQSGSPADALPADGTPEISATDVPPRDPVIADDLPTGDETAPLEAQVEQAPEPEPEETTTTASTDAGQSAPGPDINDINDSNDEILEPTDTVATSVEPAEPPEPPEGFVYIAPGRFVMGSPRDVPGRGDNEAQHDVALTRGFFIQTHEVTQHQFQVVLRRGPSQFSACGPTCPVESVTWYSAVQYANALSQAEGLTECYGLSGCSQAPVLCAEVEFVGLDCDGYRLPSEAEWEYAARAGSDASRYAVGADLAGLDSIAWHRGSGAVDYISGVPCEFDHSQFCGARPVGQLEPNGFGLYDTLGNVREWVFDLYSFYSEGLSTDPLGPRHGDTRMVRGGSVGHLGNQVRLATRDHQYPHHAHFLTGFRLARTAVHR